MVKNRREIEIALKILITVLTAVLEMLEDAKASEDKLPERKEAL